MGPALAFYRHVEINLSYIFSLCNCHAYLYILTVLVTDKIQIPVVFYLVTVAE